MSSLRYDPNGSSLLKDILEKRYNATVEQNHLALPFWNHLNSGDMVLTLGLKPELLYLPENVRQGEAILFKGARWLVGFEDKFSEVKNNYKPTLNNISSDNATIAGNTCSLSGNIQMHLNAAGFGFKLLSNSGNSATSTMLTNGENSQEWPWPSSAYLELQPEIDWIVLGSKSDKPVLAMRTFGQGTLIVSASSQWLCNQYLASVKPFQLLSSIVGEAQRFTMDESQLGLVDEVGVINLIQRYKLSHFFGVVALLLILLWWSGQVHRPSPPFRLKKLVGHHENEGLKWILQRSLRSNQTLETILSQWNIYMDRHQHRLGALDIKKLEETMTADLKDKKCLSQPLATYNFWLTRFRDKLHE